MIADRDLRLKRDLNSTPWLTDIIWSAARRAKLDAYFVAEATDIEDDHIPFMEAGVPSVDIIDLEYPAWHTPATRWTRSARAACRSSATRSSRRCRRSKRA